MPWVYNPITQKLQFVLPAPEEIQTGAIDFGEGDLGIDSGLRDDDGSIIDQGERV
jgi:hypothetical protein